MAKRTSSDGRPIVELGRNDDRERVPFGASTRDAVEFGKENPEQQKVDWGRESLPSVKEAEEQQKARRAPLTRTAGSILRLVTGKVANKTGLGQSVGGGDVGRRVMDAPSAMGGVSKGDTDLRARVEAERQRRAEGPLAPEDVDPRHQPQTQGTQDGLPTQEQGKPDAPTLGLF